MRYLKTKCVFVFT